MAAEAIFWGRGSLFTPPFLGSPWPILPPLAQGRAAAALKLGTPVGFGRGSGSEDFEMENQRCAQGAASMFTLAGPGLEGSSSALAVFLLGKYFP